MQTVREWAGKVKDWFTGGDGEGNIFEKFKTYGADIVGGFREKVGNTYTTVKDNVTSWANKVRSWFTEEGGVSTADHISEWMGRISDITADIKTHIRLDDLAIREYKPILNSGFTSDTIRHTVQETIESRGAVTATLEASGGIKEAFSEVVGEMLTPYLNKLSENTEKQRITAKERRTIPKMALHWTATKSASS